jgi:O-succinylbenzoic acid--CoA ligase
MSWVHKDFKLNNRSFLNSDELIIYAEEVSVSLHTFLTSWFSKDDFIVVKTSGSTGKPKNISLKKAYMKNSALATGAFFNANEKTKALCCLPVEYIAGKMMVVRAMVLGWHLDVAEPSSNPLEHNNQHYDFSAMVPLQLNNSLEKIEQIDQLIVGGGVVSYPLEASIQNLSTQMYATYGMTETITHIAVKSLNESCLPELVSGAYYQTLPNVSISTDARNCLVIHAPKVSDEVVVTNDIVNIISETEFEWKGRYDNVINSGGVKLHPEEIEKKLSPYISSRFFVAGLPDEQLGEKLVLIIEGEMSDFSIADAMSLTRFETPKAIFFIEKFSETPTGKVQRSKTVKLIRL